MASIIAYERKTAAGNETDADRDARRRKGMAKLGDLLETNIQNTGGGAPGPKKAVWQALKTLTVDPNYDVHFEYLPWDPITPGGPYPDNPNPKLEHFANRVFKEVGANRYVVLDVNKDDRASKVSDVNVAFPRDRANFTTAYLDDLIDDIDKAGTQQEKRDVAFAYVMFARCR